MKKIYNTLASLIAIVLIMASCDSFEDINSNPDAPTKVTASTLATRLILNITQKGGNKYFIHDALLVKQLAWGEGMESYQYNYFDRDSFGGYPVLVNCSKMVELANDGEKDSYEGLANFIKAYKLFYMSLSMGDIPYDDILQGESGKLKPKYNTQKDVMKYILADLETAYAKFASGKNFAGDPVHKGDPEKWKKTVTAFQLKVLISLSKKESDPDLNVKTKFAKIVNSGSLMSSNSDNFQLVYSDKGGQIYPLNKTVTKHGGYGMISNMIVDNFKKTEDYRLFYYAKPAKSSVDASAWDSYIGVDPSITFDEIKTAFATDECCKFNNRYTNLPSGEPVIRLGYAEQNFILAEAALRGWITGDASDYYKKGIKASMEFIANCTPDDPIYHSGRKITATAIDNVLNHPQTQLSGDTENKIKMVLTQKYLASFMHAPWDSYYDYRRTGYPVLPINPKTNQNDVKDKMPLRWMYPTDEYDYNRENVEEAVKRQWGGVEDVNKAMWIIK